MPSLLASLLSILAAAEAGALGAWTANGARLELTGEEGKIIGKLAAPAHLPQEQAQKKGHILGAKNMPWSRAVKEDGTFRPQNELRDLYEGQLGLLPDQKTFVYCRIGERSSHTWFVLRELLGFKDVRNYDGSWCEYGSLIDVPIELEYRSEAEAAR